MCKLQMLFLGLLVRQREEFVVFQSKKATPHEKCNMLCYYHGGPLEVLGQL